MSQEMNKREIILAAIKAGGATRESLMEAASVNKAGLASQLSYLNTRGLNIAEVDETKAEFPICKDGVFYMGTLAEYNAKSSPVGTAKKAEKTVEMVIEAAQKREDKASSAYTKANAKAEANPGDAVLEKAAEIRRLELELASIKLGHVQAGNFDYENVTIVDSLPEGLDVADEAPADDLLGVD